MSEIVNFPNGGEDFKPLLTGKQVEEIEKIKQTEPTVMRRSERRYFDP